MPVPLGPLAVAGIQAGGELLTGATNALFQGAANRKARRFALDMYGRQRADAHADWMKQNEYNSPAAQMQRFKEAGLNPNLIYGQGNEASPIRSSSAPDWSPTAPQFNNPLASAGMDYVDVTTKQQQQDNLTTQNEILKKEVDLKTAQILSTLLGNDSKAFDLGLKGELRQTSVDMAKQLLAKVTQDMDLDLKRDSREHRTEIRNENLTAASLAASARSLEEAASRILQNKATTAKVRQEIANLIKDGQLKQMDINLRKLGINPSDPTWQRVLGQFMSNPNSLKNLTSPDPFRIKEGRRLLDSLKRR